MKINCEMKVFESKLAKGIYVSKTAEIMQNYDLLKFAVSRSNGSSFLLITQCEMPFINKSEATKRSNDRKINGKCTIFTLAQQNIARPLLKAMIHPLLLIM